MLLPGLAVSVSAQPTPDGPPFVIDAVGLAALGEPRVAAGPGGETVALWVGECPGLAVCVRTWDSGGGAVAGPVGIDVPVAELDAVPALAAVSGGEFWVAWSRPGSGFAREVAMRRFAASGAALGIERLVAAESGQVLAAPVLAADPSGALVAAWERRRFEGEFGGQPVTVGVEIRVRRFSASGTPLGGAFRVDTVDGDLVAAPAVAVAPDGTFLVAWESFGFSVGFDGVEAVLAQRFTPEGGGAVAAGPPVQVHPSGGRQLAPAAAASSTGTFLVVWEGPFGEDRRVFGQVYGAAGPLWAEPFALGAPAGDQARPAASGAGAFVVAWEDVEGGALFAQRRDALGVPLDGGFRVDAGDGVALTPAVAALPGEGAAGGLLAAWSARHPDFSRQVLGRRYAGTAAPPEPCVTSEAAACLGPGGRFRVTAAWSTAAGDSGVGVLRPLTADTAAYWFFDEANLELVVKVLAACPVNAHHWVFAAGLTDVAVTLVVEDTATGARRTYVNPQRTAFQPIQDTAAFTCP